MIKAFTKLPPGIVVKMSHCMLIMMFRVIFTAIVLLIFASPARSQDWELSKEKNGITVYTRENPDSPIKEFKAVTIFEVELEELFDVLMDVENYPKWYERCEKAQLISEDPGGEYVYYTLVSLPFPFSNRDVVSSMYVVDKEDVVVLQIDEKKNLIPEKEGIVRMPVSEGHWKLTRLGDQKTKLEHQFKGDPAGNIPSGIVNMFLVGGPINSLTQLREFLENH